MNTTMTRMTIAQYHLPGTVKPLIPSWLGGSISSHGQTCQMVIMPGLVSGGYISLEDSPPQDQRYTNSMYFERCYFATYFILKMLHQIHTTCATLHFESSEHCIISVYTASGSIA